MNKISGSQTTETCSRRTIILLDNLGVGERNPEENGERHNHRSSADNGSSHNIRFKLGESERRSTLVDCMVDIEIMNLCSERSYLLILKVNTAVSVKKKNGAV